MTDFTSTEKGMAIVPKFPALLSLCSSLFIVQHVCRDRKRRGLTYHRLLLGMSISDIIGSFGLFLSTWPAPKGEAYLAVGNVNTCIATGFVNQSAILCTPAYNATLGVYYLLVIVKGWKEERVRKVEQFLHAIPVMMGLGTGIAGIPLKLYNSTGHSCWIASGLPNHPENHNPNFQNFRLGFLYTNIWAIVLFLALVMAIIYSKVLQQERKMDRYNNEQGMVRKRENSRRIRNQAFLYVGCMYMSWLFGSILRMIQYVGHEPPPFLNIVFVFFLPLQGFFNLVVYIYPRREQYLKTMPSCLNCCCNMLTRVRHNVSKVIAAPPSEGMECNITEAVSSEKKDYLADESGDDSGEASRDINGAIDELATIIEY